MQFGNALFVGAFHHIVIELLGRHFQQARARLVEGLGHFSIRSKQNFMDSSTESSTFDGDAKAIFDDAFTSLKSLLRNDADRCLRARIARIHELRAQFIFKTCFRVPCCIAREQEGRSLGV